MTVPEILYPRIQYSGPLEVGARLTLSFQYSEPNDIFCVIDGAIKIYNVDYSVAGSTVTLNVSVPSGKKVTLYRNTPLKQEARFPQNQKFDSEKIQECFDRVCLQQQEQNEKFGRCVMAPVTFGQFDGTLPAPRAGGAILWNDTLNGFITSSKDIRDLEKSWENKQDKLVSGVNIKTINNTSILGPGNINTNPFPSQAGNAGKYLMTNGTSVSWQEGTYITIREW